MVSNIITIKERDLALQEILEQERKVVKKARREPLTLNLQGRIARSVGSGRVNLEFKRINKQKRLLREKELSQLRFAKQELFKIKIKQEPKKKKLDSFETDLSSLQINL